MDSEPGSEMASVNTKPLHPFPETLYVMKPFLGTAFPGYPNFNYCEQDDTLGVYRLERICRVKHIKKIVLVDEPGIEQPTGRISEYHPGEENDSK